MKNKITKKDLENFLVENDNHLFICNKIEKIEKHLKKSPYGCVLKNPLNQKSYILPLRTNKELLDITIITIFSIFSMLIAFYFSGVFDMNKETGFFTVSTSLGFIYLIKYYVISILAGLSFYLMAILCFSKNYEKAKKNSKKYIDELNYLNKLKEQNRKKLLKININDYFSHEDYFVVAIELIRKNKLNNTKDDLIKVMRKEFEDIDDYIYVEKKEIDFN